MANRTGADGADSSSDAIIRAAALERDDFTQAVIQFEKRYHVAVQSSLFQPITSASDGAQFGDLTRVPIEVMSTICSMLDAKSAFQFSHVSRRARETTATVPAFSRVRAYGSEALRAVLKTGFGSHLSVADIDRALTSSECVVCKEFGCFFFIPLAARCCFECLRCEDELGAIKLSDLQYIMERSAAELKKAVPVLRTLPGTYRDVYLRTVAKPRRRRMDILSEKTGLAYAVAQGEVDAPDLRLNCEMVDCYRFMAATRLPFFDTGTGVADAGLCCRGCREARQTAAVATWTSDFKVRQKMFLEPKFLEHFASCTAAQECCRSARS
ncbi:n-acetyltransferase ats1 [Pestalotiopsis sp. IQ-011]